jgi:hypothetical protein
MIEEEEEEALPFREANNVAIHPRLGQDNGRISTDANEVAGGIGEVPGFADQQNQPAGSGSGEGGSEEQPAHFQPVGPYAHAYDEKGYADVDGDGQSLCVQGRVSEGFNDDGKEGSKTGEAEIDAAVDDN